MLCFLLDVDSGTARLCGIWWQVGVQYRQGQLSILVFSIETGTAIRLGVQYRDGDSYLSWCSV